MSRELNIGHVSFCRDDVRSTYTQYTNNEKIHCVWLKNGTKVSFKDQDINANAAVTTGYDAGNNNKYGTGFSNIKGLTIQGTDNQDYYHITNCEDYNIDVTNGGQDEVRIVNDPRKNNGTVFSDSSDKVDFVDTSKGMSMSEGFFIRK